MLAALLVPAGGAAAAADDPWVAYAVNSVVTRGGQPSAVVVRSNPVTGALEEISRNGGQGNLFEHPYDIAVAPGGGSLYVVDMGAFAQGPTPAADGRVIRVDPATGVQSLVSQGGELVDPAGIAVAPDGTLFVVENVGVGPAQNPAVVRIDPASGAQSVLTRGGNLCYPFGIAIEPSGNLIVTDFGDLVGGTNPIDCPQDFGSVVRVNPAGAQQILSFNDVPNPGNLLRGVFGAAIEPGGGILVVNQTGAQAAVAAINPQNGSQTAVTPNSSAADAFELPQRVAVLPDGNLLVADYALNDQEGGLVAVDRATGAARILRQGTLFNNPLGLATVVNRAPSAAITFAPKRVRGGKTVTYDASGSADPEGLGLRYAWDLDGNGEFELSTGGVARATASFKQSTTMTPRVRVLDPHGGAAVGRGEQRARGRHDPPGDRRLPRLLAHDRDLRGRAPQERALPLPALRVRGRAGRDRASAQRAPQGRPLRRTRQGPQGSEALHALAPGHHAPQAGRERSEQRALLRQGPRARAARRPLPRAREGEGRGRQFVAAAQGRLQRGALEVHAAQ